MVRNIIFFILISFAVTSCNQNEEPEIKTGKVSFKFEHKVDGNPIEFDTLKYVNAAGNHYLVNVIQYFISDVKLWKNGNPVQLGKTEDIHYVDTDIPGTWEYHPGDDITPDIYDSVTFIFGITEEKNKSFMFVNPPESYMFWPEYLGGGYHYMKLNGKWVDTDGVLQPFNFHLGIGQIYDDEGNIIKFVQNYFEVSLPGSQLEIKENVTTTAVITMNVEEWFEDPNVFDFNYWGGHIMENQQAMQAAKENGHNVFSFRLEK